MQIALDEASHWLGLEVSSGQEDDASSFSSWTEFPDTDSDSEQSDRQGANESKAKAADSSTRTKAQKSAAPILRSHSGKGTGSGVSKEQGIRWSVSSDFEAVVVATKKRTLMWTPSMTSRFICNSPDDEITAVSYLRIHSPRVRRPHFAIIGYRSGHFRIFDFDGHLLICQLLHNQPLVQIKVRGSPNYPTGICSDETEDVTLLFERKVAVTIDGANLVASLESCVLQLGRFESQSELVNVSPLGGYLVDLAYKKWSFDSQIYVNDVACIGLGSEHVIGSLLQNPKKAANTFRFIAVGSRPFISFYAASEEQSSWSKAGAFATAVATKLTSAVMNVALSWWGKPKAEAISVPAEQKPTIEPPLSISCPYSVNDMPRNATEIICDPTGRFGLSLDSFGRVLLLDTVHFSLMYMWKGYRDAQCGFIHSSLDDQNTSTDNPCSLRARVYPFVVIYAPRLDAIEVWKLPRVERISSWKVATGSRLLCTFPGLGYKAGDSFTSQSYLVKPDGDVVDVSLEYKKHLRQK